MGAATRGRAIFRESALEAHRRGLERDVIPRLISWPVVLGCWLLLGILTLAALSAWRIHVPAYADGSGVILRARHGSSRVTTKALLFLPASQVTRVRPGLPVDIQIDADGRHVPGTITNIKPGIAGPDRIRKRYAREGVDALQVPGPSVVVIVRLKVPLSPSHFAGSVVSAHVTVGSQPLVDLLPDIGPFLRGG